MLLTNKPSSCIDLLQHLLLELYGVTDIVEIDLLQCENDFYHHITDQMVIREEGMQPKLHEIIIWKNLESAKLDFERKNSIVQIFNELEQYNTLRSRNRNNDEPFKLGNFMVLKPEFFLVIPVIKSSRSLPKIHQHIKDCFWFAQYCYLKEQHDRHMQGEDARSKVLKGRIALLNVFAKPQIQEYISSLLVFTRSHRLCSLAPLTTRPTLRAKDRIMELAKALVVLRGDQETQLFVTPEYVKVAYRKIGYWLIDWETNALFNDGSVESEYRKRMEITILTGDWYGSEWNSAEKYMEKFASTEDKNSTTGFTNFVVEDVLLSVHPPL